LDRLLKKATICPILHLFSVLGVPFRYPLHMMASRKIRYGNHRKRLYAIHPLAAVRTLPNVNQDRFPALPNDPAWR
jgi:hypothetical protein